MLVGLMLLLSTCSGREDDTHYTVSFTDESGVQRERIVPEEAFRTKVVVFPLVAQESFSLGSWLAHGFPLMLWVDLLQDIYVQDVDPSVVDAKMAEMGYGDNRAITPIEGRRVAIALGAEYFTTGVYTSDGMGIDLRMNLFRTDPRMTLGTLKKFWPNVFGAVDSVSVWLHTALAARPEDSAGVDRPVAEISTGSIEAMRVFSQGWWMNAREQNPGRAVELLRQATRLDSTFSLAGLVLHQAGRTVLSKEARDEGLALTLRHAGRLPEPLRLAARVIHGSSGDRESARAFLSLLLKLYPGEPFVQETAARMFLAWGEQEASMAHFNLAIEQYPWRERLFESVLGLYREAGREQEARDLCLERVRRFPRNANARYHLGQLMSLGGEYEAAHLELRKALALDPDHARALEQIGLVEFRMGDLDAAEKRFRKALKLSGPAARARIYEELAGAYFDRGSVTKTLEVLEEGRSELGPGEQVLAWRLDVAAGNFLAELGNYSFALEKFRGSPLRRDVEFAWIPALAEAAVLTRMDRLDEAESVVGTTEAAIEDPTMEQAAMEMTLLGRIALARGDLDQALERFLFVEALDPVDRDNRLWIARTFRQGGDWAAADSVLTAARLHFPNDPRILTELSGVLEAQGRTDDARTALEHAVRIWSDADSGIPHIEEARRRLASWKEQSGP